MAGETRGIGRKHGRVLIAVMAAVAAATVGLSAPAGAGGGAPVAGSAFGASGEVLVVPFGGTFTLAPTPLVTLPPGGGALGAAESSTFLGGGPVTILETGPVTATTEGSTATGIVTSSASATDIGPGPFTAASASSTCTQTPTGFSGSSEILEGVVETSGTTTYDVPENPGPNTEVSGVIEGIDDTFRIIFNEHILTADSLTVNAVHMILEGPNAIGDVFIGQSVCGADASTTLSCTTRTNPAGTLIDVCTVSDPDGIGSVVVRNTATGQTSAGMAFNCSDAPTSAKFRVPAGSKYRVIVIDCDDPKNRTVFTIRPNGSVV